MSRRAIVRIAPSSIGISYSLPVRLSRTLSDSLPSVTWPSVAGSVCVSAISTPQSRCVADSYPHYAEPRPPGSVPALPAPSEEPPETAGLHVRLELRRAGLVRRKLERLVRVDREGDLAPGDAGDLGRVDEQVSALAAHDEAVEDVLAQVVEDLVHGPEPRAVRRHDGGAALERLVGDRVVVVVVGHAGNPRR